MTDEMCWQAALDYSKATGKAEGHAEGLAEGEAKGKAEMAKALKQQGVALETIAVASGLSVEEIERL